MFFQGFFHLLTLGARRQGCQAPDRGGALHVTRGRTTRPQRAKQSAGPKDQKPSGVCIHGLSLIDPFGLLWYLLRTSQRYDWTLLAPTPVPLSQKVLTWRFRDRLLWKTLFIWKLKNNQESTFKEVSCFLAPNGGVYASAVALSGDQSVDAINAIDKKNTWYKAAHHDGLWVGRLYRPIFSFGFQHIWGIRLSWYAETAVDDGLPQSHESWQ